MDNLDVEKKWTHKQKILLLETRLRNEPDFCAKRKKRTVLWEKVLREIKEVDSTFPFSRDDITRKFLNFSVTYRRIKKRNNTSGEATTTWEFFEKMDEVYGFRSDIVVKEVNLESSFNEVLTEGYMENASSEIDVPPSEPPAKRKKSEILEFLKQQADNDKDSLKKLMEIEEGKLEIERQKLEEMRNLRILLNAIVNKN